jgi:valyl-tRNA synthetase
MSKTKGNVIDPIDIINKFGTDAVRFTLASMASPGTDIAFSEERTDGYRAFANKIWNAARFLFMNVERAREAGVVVDLTMLGAALKDIEAAPLETRWILAKLSAASASVDAALTQYRFDEAANGIYQFFWGDFCDWYIEIVKLRLEFGEGADLVAAKSALTTLLAVFEAALRMLSPFMPFITEEIWHVFWSQNEGDVIPAKSIALTRYPRAEDMAADADSVSAMEVLQQMIVTVRGLRKEMGVPEKEPAPVRVFASERITALAGENVGLLRRLARVSEVEFASAALSGEGARSTADFDVAVVYERRIDVAAERERLTRDLAKYEKGLAAAEKQLGNDAFMGKAPAHIVEGLRKQAAETKILYDKTRAALDALPPSEG